ncbi:MAG: spermidine synthase [Candidatus Aminicenantes bacterium]|nr:spermidine synthase [Candidatus Aminicenantes bacterium]
MKASEIREFHTPGSGIFFRAERLLLSEKTPYQKMEIYETSSHGRVLFLDGLVQTTEKDEFFYHEMLVQPAMMAHPRPREVLIIGGGDGGTLREALRHPVRNAVLVEIDERVIEACRKHFPGLSSSFRDKRAEVVVGDGNRYVRETSRRFDVILVDSSDPVGPSEVLHQKDFYAALKNRLRPGGIIAAQAGAPLFYLEHLLQKRAFLEELFTFALYYLGPVPTYPGGLWCYAFLSDRVDPLKRRSRDVPGKLKYYNGEVHRAAFALPEFLKRTPARRRHRTGDFHG